LSRGRRSGKNKTVALSSSTLLIHPHYDRDSVSRPGHRADSVPAQPGRPIAPPIERSSTFTLDGPGAEALATGVGLREHDVYARFGTATTRATAQLLATLEHGEAALLTASGMAAITTTLTTLIRPGARFACADVVYGGTESVIRHELAARGIETVRFDASAPETLAALLDGRMTKPQLVWCESIANPLMQVARMREIAALCQSAGVPLGVDATFAGGMAQHPLTLGASVVIHSATKYLNGHSDVIAGVIIGDRALVDRCFATLAHNGGCIDPQAAWLLQRGLRTLPLRWARQVDSAKLLAARLKEHPRVRAVHYPGLDPRTLERAPLHSPGAMLAFELDDLATAERLLARVRLCTHAPSLGGLETLICSPIKTSHTQLDPETRRERGLADGLVRLSVGVEDPEDLWADLDAALSE
jgi:cystathionine beta-lyase/cystathionine gamma-synthase